jgi:hypothetical protein
MRANANERMPASGVTDTVKVFKEDESWTWHRLDETGMIVSKATGFSSNRNAAIESALRCNGGDYRLDTIDV